MKIKPILSARQITPLIEIIIVIIFFSGASAVLAQIFAKAHNDSRLAHDINSATLFVGECAERMRSSDYDASQGLDFLPGFEKETEGGSYRVYLDDKFTAAPKEKAYAVVSFEPVVRESESGNLLTGRFVCTRSDGEELVSIKTTVYYRGK